MLPEIFARAGILRRAMRFGSDLEVLEQENGRLKVISQFPAYRLANRVVWGTWRRLPRPLQSNVPMIYWTRVADWIIARYLTPCNIFHGTGGATSISLRRARQLGAAAILDNTTLHPESSKLEVEADCATIGLNPRQAARYVSRTYLKRIHSDYTACDRIITYSSAAQRSFEPFSYFSKTVLVQPGIDHERFAPLATPRRGNTFRVCYVGRIEAAKGIVHLLDAWKKLGMPDAELALAGQLFPEIDDYIKSRQIRVKLTGYLSAQGVASFLASSDLFVFPSANEGLSLALLQAMATGLPVIACRGTGADDCVRPGENGLLVPVRDTEALADAILWCSRNRDALQKMGIAARLAVEREFTIPHYVERLYRLYGSLAP